MTCPDDVTLSTYHDGQLNGAEARDVKLHVDGCVQCRKRLEDMKAADDAVAEMFRAVTPPPARRILSRAQRVRRRLLRPIPLATAAAVVLALSGAAWLLHETRPAAQVAPPAMGRGNNAAANVATAQTTIPDWLMPRFRHETYEQFVRGSLAPDRVDPERGRGLEADYGTALLQAANSIASNGRS